MSSTTSSQHLAAILQSKAAGVFEITNRPTPTPGPDDLLIEVKSIALNPVDYFQRDHGFPPVQRYPTVIGFDVAGTVISAGSSVLSDAPKPGTRVAAYGGSFHKSGDPDYGSFQTRVLVSAENVVPLPPKVSFNEGSLLPMAVATAWKGWYTMGLPRDTAHTAEDKEGMLIWSGASSVGSAALQVAKHMGFHVYATASEKHHDYLKELGANKVFDYKREDVVHDIVKAAQADGVSIRTGYNAAGELKPCLDVLKEFKGTGPAKLASAPLMPEDAPKEEGVEAKFVLPPPDEKERMELFHFIFGVWLKEKLEKGEFMPSPKVQVVEGGLQSINQGLDMLREGVSGVKLVLEV